MRSTRKKIMKRLLAFPGSTINDLAEAVGINGISVRHHLTALEAENMVTSKEERHGVGRPRFIYSLTEKGMEEFPTRYLTLTKRLINHLRNNLSSDEIKGIFGNMGEDLANDYKNSAEDLTYEKQLAELVSLFKKEGYLVEIEKNENTYVLTLLNCPYYQVGLDHNEICAMDSALISEYLSTPVKIEACILNNADRCTFYFNQYDNRG